MCSLLRIELWVDLVHNPTEQSAIECLCHGISDVHGLLNGVGPDYGLTVSHHVSAGECCHQMVGFKTQEMGNCRVGWKKNACARKYVSSPSEKEMCTGKAAALDGFKLCTYYNATVYIGEMILCRYTRTQSWRLKKSWANCRMELRNWYTSIILV